MWIPKRWYNIIENILYRNVIVFEVKGESYWIF